MSRKKGYIQNKYNLKRYLYINVYEAAKQRIHNTIDTFDTLMVSFSGGKDSLVVLKLVEEVYRERGIKDKVKVVFRDEEIIQDDVIEFVTDMYNSGQYDFRYYAIPLYSQKCCLGKTETYIQWDPNRRWLRQPPSFAIRLEEGDTRVFSQYDADEYICRNEFGTVAMLTGVRADESLKRLQGILASKKEYPYIADTDAYGVKMVKPIYDWSEQDVFIYFFRNNITYCPIYDTEMLNGEQLRVSTSVHAGSVRGFYKLKTGYPTYYQQLVNLFPEMILQERYSREYNLDATFSGYPKSVDGVRQFARDTYTDEVLLKKALSICDTAESRRREYGVTPENCYGGFPLLHLFQVIAKGQVKHGSILPMCPKNMSRKMIEFEEE